MMSARSYAAAVVMPDATVLVSGGLDGNDYLSTTEYWSAVTTIPGPQLIEGNSL
jgi:hypothetical protein